MVQLVVFNLLYQVRVLVAKPPDHLVHSVVVNDYLRRVQAVVRCRLETLLSAALDIILGLLELKVVIGTAVNLFV